MKLMAKKLPELNLSIQYPGGKTNAPTRAEIRRWVRATCDQAAEVAVRLVAADEGRVLNRDYRGKDYATNVLSFPYDQSEFIQGDLVLCIPVVVAEAHDQGKSLQHHYAHMIVHGMLHLQGYDHETSRRDAKKMESREREILAALDIPDPY
jgi:probable rRNA maturation factor